MAKITEVASARKDAGTCEACRQPILKGQAYRWTAAFRMPKRRRHADCPRWRPSELATAVGESTFLAAIEAAEDRIDELRSEVGDVDDIRSVLTDAAEAIREAAEELREKASNIEDGFGHPTEASEAAESAADEVESAADELESQADSEVEDWEEDEDDDEAEASTEDDDSPSQWADKAEWWDAQLDTASEVLGNVEWPAP